MTSPAATCRHPVIDALTRVVGAEGVLHDPAQLHVYECDGLPIAKGLPTAVVFPTTTDQVAGCVRAAIDHGLPLIPRGSGTGLAGGATAYGRGVLIITSRMTVIESIDPVNRVAVVQPGVPNLTLSQAVAATPNAQHLHFSPDPSSQRASTVGGNAATNAGGINTLKHGVTTNHILGLEMVLGDGRILRTGCAAIYDRIGPDLPGLICGSEGTLGLITKLWCRLTPRPQAFRTIYAVYKSLDACCRTVADTVATGIVPTSMEVMDGPMIRVVEDAFAYGFPTDAAALLLIEIDGIDAVLDEQLDRVVALCRANDATDIQHCADAARRAELWSARKRAFGAIGRISPSYCTQDACVPRSKLPQVMRHVMALGKQYGVPIHNVFHAGDGNIHPILLFDEDDPQQVQNILHLSEKILGYCIDIGGTPTGEHGVGVEKLHLMARMFNPATLAVFSRIKDALDPHHLFNDGKLIPSPRLEIQLLKPLATPPPPGSFPHATDPGSDPGSSPESSSKNAAPAQRESRTPTPHAQATPEAQVQDAVHSALASNTRLITDQSLVHGPDTPDPEKHTRLTLTGGVLEHHAADMTVRVHAGCTLGQLHRALAPTGQFLPLDGHDELTLGQCITHNLWGPLRVGYGSLRDLLLGLSFVDGNAQLIRVGGRTVKNVAGYDLTRLMVGSQGALGVLTDATLRTYAIPQNTLSVDLTLDDPRHLDTALPQWLTTDAGPAWLTTTWANDRFAAHLAYFGSTTACLTQRRALETLLDQAPGIHLTRATADTFERDRLLRHTHTAWQASAPALLKIIAPPDQTGTVCHTLATSPTTPDDPTRQIQACPAHGGVWVGGALDTDAANRLDQQAAALCPSVEGFRLWLRRPAGGQHPLPDAPAPTDLTALTQLKTVMDPHHVFASSLFPHTPPLPA